MAWRSQDRARRHSRPNRVFRRNTPQDLSVSSSLPHHCRTWSALLPDTASINAGLCPSPTPGW